MTALFGLVWLWWGLIGLAGFLLGIWGVYQTFADDKYLSDLKSGLANLKHRDAWLRQHFGEVGRKLWLANEARLRAGELGPAWKVPGGYAGTVRDMGRDLSEYSYNPPWGFDFYEYDNTTHQHHRCPRACDWLSAGFWEPFVFDGQRIDPVQKVEDDLVVYFQTNPRTRKMAGDPFDDNGAVYQRARKRALEIEANGGVRARGIGQFLGANDHYDPLGRSG
jgi:hypothetical protein